MGFKIWRPTSGVDETAPKDGLTRFLASIFPCSILRLSVSTVATFPSRFLRFASSPRTPTE